MKKTIIFHVLVLVAILSVVSLPTVWTVLVAIVSIAALYKMCSNMKPSEIYEVTGANFYNKLLNTSDFTKE